VAPPLERSDGQRDRHLASDLVGIGVDDRAAVGDGPESGRDTGAMQQRLDQRGLAHPAVTDERNVPDPGGRVSLHGARL
jgi:hypothetical protein